MSAVVRGTGSISYTAPTSAIRLRLRFSPLESRVLSLVVVFCACLRVASRSPFGAHHNTLAVAGQDQRVAGLADRPPTARVEALEIHRAAAGELLQLAGSDPLAARAPGRLARVHKRAAS
jgi:hypothetical protein